MKALSRELILLVAASVWFVGCASVGPPLPPVLELPRPPADLKAARKGDKVTLTWTLPARTTERESVRYLGKTRVCRDIDTVLRRCETVVGEVSPPEDFTANKNTSGRKLTASFVDRLPLALHLDQARANASAVTYSVEVLNLDGRSAGLSNQVHVSLGETLPPPPDFTARVTGQGVVLSWTGQPLSLDYPKAIRFSYRIFRRQEGSQRQTLIGDIGLGTARDLSFTDQSFEWEDTYYYHAEAFTEISELGKAGISIEGDDTPEVKVFAHDVFPPAVPGGVQAVFSGPGQERFIDLIWSPVTDTDLEGYNVYRREESEAAVRVNSELVKTPAYRDMQVQAGKTYFYSVSAMDQRGNESARSEESSERVP